MAPEHAISAVSCRGRRSSPSRPPSPSSGPSRRRPRAARNSCVEEGARAAARACFVGAAVVLAALAGKAGPGLAAFANLGAGQG